jgi:hypothetical protein
MNKTSVNNASRLIWTRLLERHECFARTSGIFFVHAYTARMYLVIHTVSAVSSPVIILQTSIMKPSMQKKCTDWQLSKLHFAILSCNRRLFSGDSFLVIPYRKGLSVNELKETAKKSQEEEMGRRRQERQEQMAIHVGHRGDSSDKLMPRSSSASLLDKSRNDSSPVKVCQNFPPQLWPMSTFFFS